MLILGILCFIFGVGILGLLFYINRQGKELEEEKNYLRDAVFDSWVRETNAQCRKWAQFYKKRPPVVDVKDIDGIKQILIYNLSSESSERELLATINFNFYRHGREVSVGCTKLVDHDSIERWPIDGASWNPKTLVLRDELWKSFHDNSEEIICSEPDHIGVLALNASN